MWVNLDADNRGLAVSVGAGLADAHAPLSVYSIDELITESDSEMTSASNGGDTTPETDTSIKPLQTIAEVMDWARQQIASLSGVRLEAVKLDCRTET
jgi:hypothetical protein